MKSCYSSEFDNIPLGENSVGIAGDMAKARRPIVATISAVIKDGAVLLVRRANAPDIGLWGFPGGKIDFGETIEVAAVRELLEETGIVAEAVSVFNAVDAFDIDKSSSVREHYVLIAVLCRWISGSPLAGDDALEAAWHNLAELGVADVGMSFGVADVAKQAAALAATTKS